MTSDFNFNSDISRGIIYYETPSLKTLLGSTAAQQMTSYEPTLFLTGAASTSGPAPTYSCANSFHCKVNYSLRYTPQVNRIYPSTVYSGQDICFDVLTDSSSSGGKSVFKTVKIGSYTVDLTTYEEQNAEDVSTWNYHQLCATAGGNTAKSSYDLDLRADVGKYLVTNFAKSYDGTSEYFIRSVPKITGVSHHSLYNAPGAILTISGEGFDPTIANNNVKVDDLDCTIFEASATDLKCQLPQKTTTTTGSLFAGGIGAYSTEYVGIVNSDVATTSITPNVKHFTDIQSRRNVDDESKFTRTVEAWFIPPQTGNYIFHASCDDNCKVYLSTTNMDKTGATEIISAGWSGWRDLWSSSSISSTAQSLTAGNHYYLKVVHDEYGSADYMTVGFTIEDTTTAHPNSQKGWKKLVIDPNHTFEKYTVTVPSSSTTNFRLQFKNSAKSCTGVSTSTDVFKCSSTTCPCVSSSFKASSTESEFKSAVRAFFNSIHSYYGSYMNVVKEGLDSAGAVTTTTADIVSYRFTATGRHALSAASSTETKIYAEDTSVTGATVTKDTDSTLPLSGNYKIRIPYNAAGDTKETEDIGLSWYDRNILNQIYTAVPEYIGRVEIKTGTTNFLTGDEGKELYYRIDGTSYGDFQIISSTTSALSGGSTTTPITLSSSTHIAASNKPVYEVIPASMVRTVEDKAQVIVTSNNLVGACPTPGACDISFISDVAEITSRTAASPYTSITFAGTSIPTADLLSVSIGTVRTCELDVDTAATATSLKCNLLRPIAGSHSVYVQTTTGAIKNNASLNNLVIPIQIDSVSPSTLYNSGGQLVTISGNFFPQSLTEAKSFADFAITFTGGSVCTPRSVSQTSITCTTASGLSGSPKVTVAFNGQTQEYSTAFTVNAATNSVTSVDKPAVSPVLKQDLVITLSSTPSSTASDYTGVLVNTDRTIYMKVNSVDTSAKTITARFPGAPKGEDFTLFVEYNGSRFLSSVTLSAKTEMTAIEITTTLPTAKSTIGTTGGDTVKLTGTGFSTTLTDNIVVFGSVKAEVVSATLTELVVRAGVSATAGNAEVTAFLKPNIVVACSITGGCNISYAEDTSLTIANQGTQLSHTNGVITITGTNFGANAKGYINGFEQTTVSSSSTEVQLKLTKMNDNEVIDLEVRTDTVNIPKVYVQVPFAPALLGVSPHQGSSGGEKITLSTVGIGLKTTSNLAVLTASGTSVCQDVTIVDSSTLTCVTNNGVSISKSALKLSYTHKSSLSGTSNTVTLSCSTATDCEYETTTAATPTITSASISGTSLSVDVSNFSIDSTYTLKVHYGSSTSSSASFSGSTVTGTFSDGFAPGVVPIRVSFEKSDRITYTSKHDQTTSLSATAGSAVSCSWAGGCKITINQAGLKAGAAAGDVTVEVCGSKATPRLDDSSSSSLVVWAPKYTSVHSLDTYKVEQAQKIYGTVTSVPAEVGKLAFDGITSTKYSSTSDDNCYVQTMFDSGKVGRVSKIRYFMNKMIDKQTNYVDKLKFQGSADGTTWTDIFAADKYMREGWNVHTPATAVKYQYYRFFSATKGACNVGEIELWGNIVEDSTATSKTCDVVLKASGSQTQTFSNHVTYQDSASSVVTALSPRYGTYKGGETVTFTGTGFSTTTSEVSVTIDGIACSVTSATSTQIQCTTGARPTVNSSPSTILTFTGATQNGHASMQTFSYKYANYWSDLDTWSGEYIPQAGNSVVIPKGQTLVVDVDSTPVLKAVIVQGSLIFAPDASASHHRTFDAEYVYVDNGAVFEAGTEDNRYTSKLTITMHGTREDPEIPVYGNKGIFVRYGQLDIHGVVRDYTWTELATTAAKGTYNLALNVKTDWQIGEQIVIASTDFDLDHAEQREITGVDNSGTKTLLTIDKPLQYKHYAGSKSYTGSNGVNADMTKTLEMRAEVGLLSRNVVYKGADDDSVEKQYGAHIMMHSPGDDSLTGRISYAEFTQVGQAFQLGRYPIHFHMIGTVHNSYVKGNAIHHTYNRACTIHGVHYLTIENNVAYETMGHTFFIEDGAETKNLLKNNLAVKSKRSWSLLNTDQTPASFWITHPDNQFIGNHAAGSDRYGFWFDLQTNPTGPSFDPNICPEFMELGEFTGNVAHSNGRYGLRLFHRFTPTDNPCAALATGAHDNREQPDESIAKPIVTHFRDFLGYKNNRTAVIGTEIGALKFHNIRAADNLLSGVEFSNTAAGPWLTSSDDYHLQDALIVAASDNAESDVQKNHAEAETTRGLKGSKTEKMRVKDTIFANFNYDSRWGAIGTCSHCEGPATDSSGRTYFFKNLYFVDSTQRVKFDTPFKEIIYDEDGTLGNSTHRWVVFYFEHLDVPECIRNEATYNGLLCNKDISIRRIVFDHATPDNALRNLPLKVMNTKVLTSSRRRNLAVSPSTCPSTSSSVSTLNTVDSNAYSLQVTLLQAYDNLKTNKTAYDEAVALYASTQASSLTTQIAAYQANMDAAQAIIDANKPLVEAEEGKFDNLWKTDMNVCNVNNYALIEYRGKANPKKNWVFNVITGYEYKVHIAQGADITTMNVAYSYKELLNGETAGAVVHFNHTERAEDFVLSYTNSTTSTKETVTRTETQLTATNTGMKMGDYHMNNVTRHLSIKFDGQSNDRQSFLYTREECITIGGCNSQLPAEGEIETTPRLWSKANSWTTGKVPVEGDVVEIESTWNMILDVADPPVLKSLEINGRLTVQNDGGNYHLQSYLIYVRKGELIVGTQDAPFTGNMKFTLHGTRADKDVYFHDKMFEGGNKVIANTGKLEMWGKTVGLKWTRLAATASAGNTTITLADTPTDWAIGDEIGIAPNGRDFTHRDFGVIKSISGKTIELESALAYEHYGAASVDSTISGGIDIRAEVVHLTRNIKVAGTNEDRWGAHVVSAHNKDSGFIGGQLVTIERKGYMILDHVEFVNCSQYDTDKAAVRFADFSMLTSTDTKSKVSNSAIHNGLGIGIMVTSADDVTVENNVVFFQHVGGIWMKKSHNSQFLGNVVAGMGARYWSTDTRLDELALYNFCNNDQNCKNLVVKNNIAAGGERVGFAIPTVACTDIANYSNNLAHSVEHGAWLFHNKLVSGKECFGNFKAYKTIEQGILGYQGYSALKVSNVETLDCGRGVSLMIGKSQDTNILELTDATFWGESEVLPKDSGSMCISIYGYWLAIATQGGKTFPVTMISSWPYEKTKSYSNWFTEGHLSNIVFKNWKSGFRQHCATTSSKEQRLFFINPNNPDHVTVNRINGLELHTVSHAAMAQFDDPPQAWAIIKDCGQFPCTGPENAVLKVTGAKAYGSFEPSIANIKGNANGATFQIIPNNPGAANYMSNCTLQTNWNAYLCYNTKIAQIMFESLDGDREDRMVSPIHVLGQSNSFNNTLNTFMDHCWDGHYTCQKRLSRFPSIVELDRTYEIYYTGTAPSNHRYTLQGSDPGDWMIVKIDFSKSIVYNVIADDVVVASNRYDRTEKKIPQLTKSKCGESRYEQITYTYEFYLTHGCIVRLEAQEHLIGLARLQMSIDEFFEDDFVSKLSFALGITTDQIRIVSVQSGSVIVYWQMTSTASSSDAQKQDLITLSTILASKYADGSLDLGAPILDLYTEVISSNGESTTVTSGTSTYFKKEIHVSVYVLLGLSGLAVLAGLIYGVIKMIRMSKTYKEVSNFDSFDSNNKVKDDVDGNKIGDEVKNLEEEEKSSD